MRKTIRLFAIVLATVLGLAVVVALIAPPADEPITTRSPVATPIATPTATPAPVATPTLFQAIAAALGRSNRNVDRLARVDAGDMLTVQWAINDNLTDSLIQTGMRLDAIRILQAISEHVVNSGGVRLVGTAPLTDGSGNVTETQVIIATYSADTVAAVDWRSMSPDAAFDTADSVQIHPALR